MLPSNVAPHPLTRHLLMGSGPRSVLLLCGFQADLNAWRWVQSRLAKARRGGGHLASVEQRFSDPTTARHPPPASAR